MTDKSISEKIRETLGEMRDNGSIDFTNKNDYSPKLKLIASDNNCDYTTVYKQMKRVAKDKGIMVNKPEQKKTSTEDKGKKNIFDFKAKKSPTDQNRLSKQKAELDAKATSLKTQIEMQGMILKSDAFEMVKTQNYFTLSMIREMVKGFGGAVADEKKYEMMSGMLASKELSEGWELPSKLTTALLIVGMAGLFIIPMLPQIKKYMNDEEEEKEKKSDEPLSPIKTDEIETGEKKEEKSTLERQFEDVMKKAGTDIEEDSGVKK